MTTQRTNNSSLMDALQQFDAIESNVVKLERLWNEINALIPGGINFRLRSKI